MFALPTHEAASIIVRSGRHSGGARAPPDEIASNLRPPKIETFEVPLSISRRFRDVQFKTLVGLAPLVPAAWYSVDDVVMVWRFGSSCNTTQIQCDGIVTAVSIGLPTPGVFPPSMFDFLLVVATENSVTLIGLKITDSASLSQINLDGYSVLLTAAPFSRIAISLTGVVLLCNDQQVLCQLRYMANASWFRSKIYMHSLLDKSLWSMLFASTPEPIGGVFFGLTFARFFVSLTSTSLRLHELVPSPRTLATGAWRHSPLPDVSVTCTATVSLGELGIMRVLDVHVDNDSGNVSVLTDSGEILTLNCQLKLIGQRKVESPDLPEKKITHKMVRLSNQTSRQAAPLLLGAFASVDGSLVVTGSGGLNVTLHRGTSAVCELGGNVLALAATVPVIKDAYGSFVSNIDSGPVLVLTGKGVVTIADSHASENAIEMLTFASPSELLTINKEEFKKEAWAKAFSAYFNKLIAPLRHQPFLVTVSGGLVRVAIAQPVLQNIAHRLAVATKCISKNNLSNFEPVAARRREFMHHESREKLVCAQREASLSALAAEITRVGECIAFLAIVSQYHSTAVQNVPITNDDVFSIAPGWLKQTCERLLQQHSSTQLVEQLKSVCPSVLCLVSPASVPFSPEGIAAMLHCAFEKAGGSVQLVLEAVRELARNTPAIAKSLNELAPILHSDQDQHLLQAYLEGLGSRLTDPGTVSLVLNWAGSHLPRGLNECVFDFCFTRQLGHQFVHLSTNAFLEPYLAARQTDLVVEAYARLLCQTNRAITAGNVLENLALSVDTEYSVYDRLHWLDEANRVYPTNKRFTTWAVARYIQIPLMLKDSSLTVNSIVPLAALFSYLNDWPELQLVAYLFAPVSEAEIVKTWVRTLFAQPCRLEAGFFSDEQPAAHHAEEGVLEFLTDLYGISNLVDAFDIWKKMDLIVAMVEYLLVANRSSGSVVEWLQETVRMPTTQIIPIYMKALREMNKWVGKVPKTGRCVSNEKLEEHFVNVILDLATNCQPAESERCMSLLILLRNYLKHQDPTRVQSVIDQLAAHTTTGSAAIS